MRRLRIIVPGACILAVGIAVAATKANAKLVYTYYYESIVGSPSTCAIILQSEPSFCLLTGNIPCTESISGIGTRQLFLSEDAQGLCVTPLTWE
ncbi:hypothetical protein [Dinghuibacter silviterrae]|uniref:hypothetical protein n=1 Tax=Dinghuibacter silviterrae TaxID=1539049 RepID=UPI0013C35D1A|nr:hypothetical protein [Dinghuibacter silviterrae]